MNLNTKLNAGQMLGYINATAPVNTIESVLEQFFPVRAIDGIDFSYIKGGSGPVELTIPSSYDGEPIAQDRESVDMINGQLPILRRKKSLSEKEINSIENAAAQASRLKDPAIFNKTLAMIYDDQKSLYDGAIAMQEYMRAKALMDGAILLKSAGGVIQADYGVPASHKETLTGTDAWTDPTAPILDHIADWKETIYNDTGEMPTVLLMNNETWKLVRANEQVRQNLIPVAAMFSATPTTGIAFTEAQVKQSILAYTGLVDIIVYTKKAKFDGSVVSYVEDNKVSLFPASMLGNTLIGTSPAERSARTNKNQNTSVSSEGIAITIVAKNEGAPYTQETQVEFVGLPSFEKSDSIFLATVA